MALECFFHAPKSEEVNVEWTAYKTPTKVGVKGRFTNVKLKSKIRMAKDWQNLALNSSVDINSKNIHTGDISRDVKIVTFFFKNMSSTKIKATITSVDLATKTLGVELKMNGKKQNISMNYELIEKKGGTTLKAKSISPIDVVQMFAMEKSLTAIHNACKELHQGKTWAEVDLNFEVLFNKKCTR